MPIIDNFVLGGGHFEFVSNHWRKKMETVFLLIYGLYIIGKTHSFKINMNLTQNYTLTYANIFVLWQVESCNFARSDIGV